MAYFPKSFVFISIKTSAQSKYTWQYMLINWKLFFQIRMSKSNRKRDKQQPRKRKWHLDKLNTWPQRPWTKCNHELNIPASVEATEPAFKPHRVSLT